MNAIHQVEVVIHVDESLSEERRSGMLSSLLGRDGVEGARFTPGRDHLMVIDYDTNKLCTIDVLGLVRAEHVGAELIGI